MKIGIYGNLLRNIHEEPFLAFVYSLVKAGFDLSINTSFLEKLNPINLPKTLKKFDVSSDFQFDIMLTVGGDGTILKAASVIEKKQIPILGINFGKLGFLTSSHHNEDLDTLISALKKRDYTIDTRSLVQVETPKLNNPFALNEVSVSRANSTSLITVEGYLNNKYLASFWADGLIVSTPTGSTGYSLSCGGPIISPDSKSLVITPIAPHNLNVRPIVIPDNYAITLIPQGRERRHLISLDGRVDFVSNKETIKIKKAPFQVKIIQFKEHTFFETLNKKLQWGQDHRNK